MLGLSRNGLRRIACRRTMTSVAAQTKSASKFDAVKNSRNNNFKNRSTAAPIEQIRLQNKFKDNLEQNKLETVHEAIEYIEWRGNVYMFTLDKILKLLGDAKDLETVSDRQLSVILSAFGDRCDTLSPSKRAEYVESLEKILKDKNVKMGILSINAMMETKLANRMKLEAVEELNRIDECGLEPNENTYAIICAIYAKQGNTKAITDVIAHVKSSGVGLSEEHINHLVYSLALNGNEDKVGLIIDSFPNMNVIRLRCTASQAIVQREKEQKGCGGFEVTEMLRSIPATAKILSIENNSYVVNVMMDLVEQGQADAFKLLSPYLMVSEDGSTLADNQLNVAVVNRAKSLLCDGKINEAIVLYSTIHSSYSNEFFIKDLKNKLEDMLAKSNDFDEILKMLVFAENRGIIKNTNEFALNTVVLRKSPLAIKVFEHVKSSGNLKQVLMNNGNLKKPLARLIGHVMIETKDTKKQAEHLADIATVLFAPGEQRGNLREFYEIIFKLSSKDVQLAIEALKLLTDGFTQREFATAIVHQLLSTLDSDHLAEDKLNKFVESESVDGVNLGRIHNLLTKYFLNKESSDPEMRARITSKLIALDYPRENMKYLNRFAAKNTAKFIGNQMVSDENASKIIGMLEEENRVSISADEMKECLGMLKDMETKAKLIGKLKKSQTMIRWKSSRVDDLLTELENFSKDSQPAVLNALREVIVRKTIYEKKDDVDFGINVLEKAQTWKKESEKALPRSLRQGIAELENRLMLNSDDVLADRIWLLRSGHLSADVCLAYASRLFLNGNVERADQVCQDLRESSQQILASTLDKMGRSLKGVDGEKIGELATYLGKQFNLKQREMRRIVAQVKLEKLEKLIIEEKMEQALQMAIQETRESGRAFGQIPLMVAAIKRNDTKLLESVHVMIKSAHSQEMANINLSYALIEANHVEQAKKLVERHNLEIEGNVLKYFVTLASSKRNVGCLKNLFMVFNGRASTMELNGLLEIVTRLMWRNGDVEGLKELEKEIESSSFPLQTKLQQVFKNLKMQDLDKEL